MGKVKAAAAMISALSSIPVALAAPLGSPPGTAGLATRPAIVGLLHERLESAKGAKDEQALQGTWNVVKKTKNGEADNANVPATLKFSGNTVTLSVRGEVQSSGTFAIDESKTPKRITMTGTSGQYAGKTVEAIYELDGDTFKFAYGIGDNAGSPPKDFAGGQGQAVETLERQEGKTGKSEG